MQHARINENAEARLLERGFAQVQGVDYNNKYAPVVKFASICSLLALVSHLDLELYQMDVVIAFLNGEVQKDI